MGLGTRTGLPVKATYKAIYLSPLPKTKLVQIYLPPPYCSFLSLFFPFQEKQHKFEGDGEFNLVYENL